MLCPVYLPPLPGSRCQAWFILSPVLTQSLAPAGLRKNGRSTGDQSITTCFPSPRLKGTGPGLGPHRARPALGRAPSCPSQAAPAPLTMYEREEDNDEEAWLQLRPVEPLPSQCCGGGCSPCVFDLYHRDLARWEAARASKDRSLLGGEESQVR